MLREYQEEIKKLRQMLETNNLTGNTGKYTYTRHERDFFKCHTHQTYIKFPRYVSNCGWSPFISFM
jgi:hypothetical protein